MKSLFPPVAARPALPTLAPAPTRQLSITFETTALIGLSDQQRGEATRALATLLLQAAGVRPQEDDDAQP